MTGQAPRLNTAKIGQFAEDILRSKVAIDILLFLYEHRDEKRKGPNGEVLVGAYYVREIYGILNISPKDAIRALHTLLTYKLVEREIIEAGGRQYHYYSITERGIRLVETLATILQA